MKRIGTEVHTWTQAEAEQLALTMEAMRDLYKVISDALMEIHQRLLTAEAWIEQHKAEAAAFKKPGPGPGPLDGPYYHRLDPPRNPAQVWIDASGKPIPTPLHDLGGEA